MIELLKYANISLIYTKDLTFYNPADIPGSIKFCKTRGISFLPDENRKFFYELNEDIFLKRHINETRAVCNPTDPIFSKATLKKFENNNTDNVLLVTDDSRNIVGVVHIVDYNNDIVYFELYKLIFEYEKMLREYLVIKGFSNKSFKLFIDKQQLNKSLSSDDRKYWRKRHKEYFGSTVNEKSTYNERQLILGPFQTFYLSDLLEFFNYISPQEICIPQYASDSIKSLRNRIAHGHDIISPDIIDTKENSGHLYDFKGLSKFIDHAILFFKSYENLENLWQVENHKQLEQIKSL
jgi:hypothetical protein